jgi:hypothetical protein
MRPGAPLSRTIAADEALLRRLVQVLNEAGLVDLIPKHIEG